MNDAKWIINLLHTAAHAFTNPNAGNEVSKGAAYNKDADARSWERMKIFLREVFKK